MNLKEKLIDEECIMIIIDVIKYAFGMDYFCQLILLFNLFLLLFMGLTALFGIIHKSHYTISTNFYLYLDRKSVV